MKLEHYLEKHEISTDRFAEMINVSNRMTVYRYIKGKRIPRPEIMNRIIEATQGNVGAEDFFISGSINKKQKTPYNTVSEKNNIILDSLDEEFSEEYEINVIYKASKLNLTEHTVKALNELGKRAEYKNNKFYLDERPTTLKLIFYHANELRIRRGIIPLYYPST